MLSLHREDPGLNPEPQALKQQEQPISTESKVATLTKCGPKTSNRLGSKRKCN